MKSKLTSDQWIQLIKMTIKHYNEDGMRLGQAYMNSLAKIDEELYKEVTDTEADPFYDDVKLFNFINFLYEDV